MSNGQTPEEIEADIARQREQLADTVDQLSSKLDVKSQASAKFAQAKNSATDANGKPRPEILGAAGGVTAGIIGLTVWKLTKRR